MSIDLFGIIERLSPSLMPARHRAVAEFAKSEGSGFELYGKARVWNGLMYSSARQKKESYWIGPRYQVCVEGYFLDSINEGKFSSAEAIGHRFLEQNPFDVLPELNGRFTIAAWDSIEQKLILSTDRHGFRPVYIFDSNDLFAYSTRLDLLLALTGVVPEIDKNSVYEFIHFQFILNDRTLLKKINLVPYGTMLEVTEERTFSKRYWSYPVRLEKKDTPLADLVCEGAALLKAAVEKCIRSGEHTRIAIPLSGGLDSRTIAGIVASQGTELGLFHTYISKFERCISTTVATRLGRTLYEMNLYETDWSRSLETCIPLSDGHLSCHQFWLFEMIEHIADSGYDCVFDGAIIDVLLQPLFLLDRNHMMKSPVEVVTEILSIYPLLPDAYLQNFFSPDVAINSRSISTQNILSHIESFNSNEMVNISQFFYFTARGRRYIWPMSNLHSRRIEVLCPGIDKDLFEFGTRIPYELRKNGQLYRKIITYLFPDLATVPWARTRLPLRKDPSSFRRKLSAQVNLWTYLLSRATRGIVDNKAYSSYNYQFRRDRRFRDTFLAVLSDQKTVERGVVTRDSVERLISYIDSGRNCFSLIETIVTLELFFRKYVDRPLLLKPDIPSI